jgi:methylenetetrahydrofolate dehydrogenase (NADP+)/methenyltetrahydrofolate cyclohydrolase
MILDGARLSQKVEKEIKLRLKEYKKKPKLGILLIEGDFASEKYVEKKAAKAEELGIDVIVSKLSAKTTTEEVLKDLNILSSECNGIMIQLPLPKEIDKNTILNAIPQEKDVDGLSPANLGLLFNADPKAILPATPRGILALLADYRIDPKGENVVIVGTSNLVGVPLQAKLIEMGATVQMCNEYTENLEQKIGTADILVSAVGEPKLIKAEWVKEDSVVIDVGFGRDGKGNISGDVDFDGVVSKASHVTPVPGGVGPMTVISLLNNLLDLYDRQNG